MGISIWQLLVLIVIFPTILLIPAIVIAGPVFGVIWLVKRLRS